MASVKQRRQQFLRYPNHEKAYKNALRKALFEKPSKIFGTDVEAFWDWWMSGLSIKRYFGKKEQMEIDL